MFVALIKLNPGNLPNPSEDSPPNPSESNLSPTPSKGNLPPTPSKGGGVAFPWFGEGDERRTATPPPLEGVGGREVNNKIAE